MFGLGRIIGMVAMAGGGMAMAGGPQPFEDFGPGADQRWRYVSDRVMGGVSEGAAQFGAVDGRDAVRLTGGVSTENNGGFIQVQRLLPDGLPADTTGLRLTLRGNAETYYVFVRTAEMTRPWYYYNARFDAGPAWQEVEIPLAEFTVSHAHLAETIDPAEVISIGIVAYGRDFQADLAVDRIDLY